MKTYFCNFIADMQGPDFLLFYTFYALILIAIAYIVQAVLRAGVKSTKHSKNSFDEYDIALLRNGIGDVIGVAIFNLTRKKFLIKKEDGKLYRNPNHSSIDKLNKTEQLVLGEFAYDTGKKIDEILGSRNFLANIKNATEDKKEKLENIGFLFRANINKIVTSLKNVILVALIAVGAYKIIVALERGHFNIIFLVLLTVIASILVFVLIKKQRLTNYGKAYLSELQVIYADKKSINPTREQEYYADENAGLYIGLFGLSTLSGVSEYDYLASEYKSSTYSSGGCGGSCSSDSSWGSCSVSSCSSASCGGGGCGGCGGCGG